MGRQIGRLRNVIDVGLLVGGAIFIYLALQRGWDMAEIRKNSAIAAVVLMLAANLPYMLNALFGEARPVFVTWLLLGIITLLVVKRQLSDGVAMSTVYPLLAAGAMNLLNCLAGIRKASFRPKLWDMVCALVAGLAIYLWQTTDNARNTIIFLTLAGVVSYVPTVLSAWNHPEYETFQTYPRNTVRYGLIAFAAQPYGLVTLLYPGVWVVINALFTVFLPVRRMATRSY